MKRIHSPSGEIQVVVPDSYEPLGVVFMSALLQCIEGKGSERHALDGEAFMEQDIMKITADAGVGFPAGQALKKTSEALGMVRRGGTAKAQAEFYGAMVYLAAAVIALDGPFAERIEG